MCAVKNSDQSSYKPRADGYKHAMSVEHLNAAKAEKLGRIVAKKANGVPYDHLTETRQAIRGIQNSLDKAKKTLGQNNLSPNVAASIQKDISELSKMRDRARRILGE
jgi:hypothetical protein